MEVVKVSGNEGKDVAEIGGWKVEEMGGEGVREISENEGR